VAATPCRPFSITASKKDYFPEPRKLSSSIEGIGFIPLYC